MHDIWPLLNTGLHNVVWCCSKILQCIWETEKGIYMPGPACNIMDWYSKATGLGPLPSNGLELHSP